MVVALNEDNEMDIKEKTAPKGFMKPSVLDTFTDLRDSDDKFTLDGGVKLLAFLSKSEDGTNLEYSLKRILRSLGANQLSMRTGYFSTLVVLLRQFPDVTVNHLLKVVKQELQGAGSKSETGDISVGQILVCGAVLRSGLMLRSSEQEQKDVISLLISASNKRSYLKSAAHLFLVDFLDTLDEDQFKSIIWNNVKSELKKLIQEQTIDTLYFLMKAQEKYPDVVKIRKFFGVEQVLCEDTIHVIAEKLMTITDFNQTNHPIYKFIGETISNSEHLELFWTSGIDGQLKKHNRNKEVVYVTLLKIILENIQSNHEVIPKLLTNNFFKYSFDWFKGLQTASKIRNNKEEEDDNKMMVKKEREVYIALANALKGDDVTTSVKIEVLKKLLLNPGDMNIAEITSTPIIKSVIVSLNKEGVKKAAKLFKAVLLNDSKKIIKEGVERPWFNYERLKASEYLSYLVTHPAIIEDTTFRLNYMKVLMCFGFFKISGNEDINISSDLSAAIKTSFYRCLNARLPTVDVLVEILRSLCNFIDENLSNEKVKNKLAKQFPEENVAVWRTLKETCDNIERSTEKRKVDNVFLILLYQLGLFLFSEPKNVAMAKDSLKELISCYSHCKNDKIKNKKQVKEGELSEEEPEWIEVLTEVLLSILSCESSVLRAAVQCAFRLLIENLTPSSIGQIVSILDPESEDNPLIKEDSESDSDESDDDKKSTEDSNKLEDNGENNSNEDSSDDSESDTELEEDEDEENMKIPDQVRMAVQKALGSAAPDTDTESIDADMIDEEEGKKLDKALGEAFKLLRQGKNKKSKKERKDKKTLTDFRIRVLDLVDIYLEKEPSMEVCLAMIGPLMRCLQFCIQDNQQRELENRVRKTIKLLTSTKKFSSMDGVTIQILADYLNETIEKGSRSHFIFQSLGDMVTECGAFIIICSNKITVGTPMKKKFKSPLLDIYKDSLSNFFQCRSSLLPIIFFHRILKIDWEGNYVLSSIIIDNVFNPAVRQFRRHEGLELLIGFLNSLKGVKPEKKSHAKEKLAGLELKIEEAVKNAFNPNNNDFIVKDQFYKLLGKVLTCVEQLNKILQIEDSIDFKALGHIITSSKKGMKEKRMLKENNTQENELKSEQNSKNSAKKRKKDKQKKDVQKQNGPQAKIAKIA